MAKTLGRRIEELRLSRGFSKKELGERAHIDPTYVGKIERGERVNISPEILDALATALDYHLFDLLTDIGLGRQGGLDREEQWQRDLIRAFGALPPELQESQLRILLLLEEQVRRRTVEPAAKEPQDTQGQVGARE